MQSCLLWPWSASTYCSGNEYLQLARQFKNTHVRVVNMPCSISTTTCMHNIDTCTILPMLHVREQRCMSSCTTRPTLQRSALHAQQCCCLRWWNWMGCLPSRSTCSGRTHSQVCAKGPRIMAIIVHCGRCQRGAAEDRGDASGPKAANAAAKNCAHLMFKSVSACNKDSICLAVSHFHGCVCRASVRSASQMHSHCHAN